jgi:hypothetical protein
MRRVSRTFRVGVSAIPASAKDRERIVELLQFQIEALEQ